MSLKLETVQETFAYKLRGAVNAMLRLIETGEPPVALVTASAGNHGRALATAAAKTGLPLTVYVPEQAPAVKLEAMRALGATLVPCRDYDEAEARAKEHGGRGPAKYVSPYSHPDVIAGDGTVTLEILEQDPTIDNIVVSVGGGGLLSGTAIAAGSRAQAWGVEAEASSPFTRSLAEGRIVRIAVQPSVADGLVGNLDPDTITFDLVRRYAAGVVNVPEREVEAAIRQLAAEERVIAEGAAAVAVAGVACGRLQLRGRRTAVVLSGANIDPGKLRSII